MASVIQIIVSGKDEASKVLGGVGSAISGLGTIALGAGALGGAAVIGLGAAFTKLAVDAAPLADIKTSFEGIATASGTTSKAVLADFKENTAGMLSNADAMATYNEAAQLITPTFANQLPEAMKYLSKVQASTGEDLDYLVDSLVKGVGRESTAILDNLKIQVNREEALKKGAAALGITTEEMTKAQRQEALMSEVMAKLAENTAALPDVTESANAKMKAIRATLIDVKDSIALALQPALLAVLSPLGNLAEKYGPQVTAWAEKAGVWLGENLPKGIEKLKEGWISIQPGLIWAKGMFQSFTETFLPKLSEAWSTLQKGWESISSLYNRDLKPALAELWKALGLGKVKSDDIAGGFGGFSGVMAKLVASGVIDLIKNAIKGLTLVVEGVTTGINLLKQGMEIAHGVFDRIHGVIDRIKDAFQRLKDSLAGFSLPSWLTPGSPTPLEIGLLGIGKALAEVQGLAGKGMGLDGMSRVNNTGNTTNNYLTMNVQTQATSSTVISGFNTMRALV